MRVCPFPQFLVGKKKTGFSFVPTSMAFVPGLETAFFAGGQDAIQVWTVDPEAKKLEQATTMLGKIKRTLVTLLVSMKS